MNWRLLFFLSFCGLLMGTGTELFIPMKMQPFCWGAIFIICAIIIDLNCKKKFFLNGFFLGIFAWTWMTLILILFYHTKTAFSSDAKTINSQMPYPDFPRLMLLCCGVLLGITSGIIQGSLAFVSLKFLKQK